MPYPPYPKCHPQVTQISTHVSQLSPPHMPLCFPRSAASCKCSLAHSKSPSRRSPTTPEISDVVSILIAVRAQVLFKLKEVSPDGPGVILICVGLVTSPNSRRYRCFLAFSRPSRSLSAAATQTTGDDDCLHTRTRIWISRYRRDALLSPPALPVIHARTFFFLFLFVATFEPLTLIIQLIFRLLIHLVHYSYIAKHPRLGQDIAS